MAENEERTVGTMRVEGIPEFPESLLERTELYSNSRSAVVTDWDGDALLISTRFAETAQIHRVSSALGQRQQLTFYSEPVRSAAVIPASDATESAGFIFLRDKGGNEKFQLYFFNFETATATMLTDGKSRYGGVKLSKSRKRYAYYSTQRNGKDWDIYVADTGFQESPRCILERDGCWSPVAFSWDDAYIICRKYVSINESYLVRVNIATGKQQDISITPANASASSKIAYGGATMSVDGNALYCISDADQEFQNVWKIDLATGASTCITNLSWGVSSIRCLGDSSEGDELLLHVNEDGSSTLYLLYPSTQRMEKVFSASQTGDNGGVIASIVPHPQNGRRLAITLTTPRTPGDVFLLDLSSEDLRQRQPVRWTQSEIGGLNVSTFSCPTLVRYSSFDGLEIPMYYYRPRSVDAETPVPVLIHIHGGPESQVRPTYFPLYQYFLAELKVAVLDPNVRGSSGYGKSYLLKDNGYLREDSVRDIGALLEWIERTPGLDASRVAVFGGSYGGYMTLASMIHYADKLRCGAESVGISNFVTFLKNTSDYRRDMRREEYGDERDPEMCEFLTKISPLTRASELRKPMLIAQGANDPRVPASESAQIVSALHGNNTSVWYCEAADEGHGFQKKRNRDFYRNALILFMKRFLLD